MGWERKSLSRHAIGGLTDGEADTPLAPAAQLALLGGYPVRLILEQTTLAAQLALLGGYPVRLSKKVLFLDSAVERVLF